jgi:hypothetical protein
MKISHRQVLLDRTHDIWNLNRDLAAPVMTTVSANFDATSGVKTDNRFDELLEGLPLATGPLHNHLIAT